MLRGVLRCYYSKCHNQNLSAVATMSSVVRMLSNLNIKRTFRSMFTFSENRCMLLVKDLEVPYFQLFLAQITDR